jgi:hypothetical protein
MRAHEGSTPAPSCPSCQIRDHVRPLRDLVSDATQYWACDAGMVAWMSRDEKDLRLIFSHRNPA